MKILHLDSGREWRGGQQQLFYLLNFLAENHIETAAACRLGGPLQTRLRENQISYFPWLTPGESPLQTITGLGNIIAAFNPDIIHCHDARTILPGLWAGHFLKKKPVIAHRRVDFPVSKAAVFFKYRRLDHTIAVSQMIKDLLIQSGVQASKICVVHDGIDGKRFVRRTEPNPMRAELGIPASAIHVGNAGSLVDHKGQSFLIEAAASLVPTFSDLYFSIAGEGPLRQNLQKRILELNLAGHFKLPGFIRDMPTYYHSLDIYAHPSKMEGMGSAIIEAMACGKPIIAAQSGGIPEIVSDHGYLVAAKDVKALAAGLNAMISSWPLRKKLAALALRRSSDFDFHTTNRKLLDLYCQLLAAK